MPENYLHLARDVVDALGRAENNQPLQFNEIQCRLLRRKLQERVTPLVSRVDKDSLPPEKQALFNKCCQGAALLELYRMVKRAEAIMHGCSTLPFLHKTLRIGTTRWMAPEVMSEPEKDSIQMKYYPLKSDVYSYAMTCYEILSGTTPFEGVLMKEVVEKVKAGLRPTLPNSLPTSLLSLIKCCWDGDVRRRPSFSTISTELRHLKGIYLISDCEGSSQTFSMPPFSIAPEDVDTEIETDDRAHDISTLFNRLHDLQLQVQEKDHTLREQTEMLR